MLAASPISNASSLFAALVIIIISPTACRHDERSHLFLAPQYAPARRRRPDGHRPLNDIMVPTGRRIFIIGIGRIRNRRPASCMLSALNAYEVTLKRSMAAMSSTILNRHTAARGAIAASGMRVWGIARGNEMAYSQQAHQKQRLL